MLQPAQEVEDNSYDASESVAVSLSNVVFPGRRESPDRKLGFHSLTKRLPFSPVGYGQSHVSKRWMESS